MLVFMKNEICLMQMDDELFEEVEIVEEIHQKLIDFEDGERLWFVYKVEICFMPDILLYVKPEVLYKMPNKDSVLEWESCIWKPKN